MFLPPNSHALEGSRHRPHLIDFFPGGPPRLLSQSGRTALILALQRDPPSYRLVKALLDAGADVRSRDKARENVLPI